VLGELSPVEVEADAPAEDRPAITDEPGLDDLSEDAGHDRQDAPPSSVSLAVERRPIWNGRRRASFDAAALGPRFAYSPSHGA
jgi:hypothetical protein